jgi:hypothetical protein
MGVSDIRGDQHLPPDWKDDIENAQRVELLHVQPIEHSRCYLANLVASVDPHECRGARE